jgi:hypothetical protein
MLFFLASNIPLYEWSIIYLSLHLLKDIWVFPIWAIINIGTINIFMYSFCEPKFIEGRSQKAVEVLKMPGELCYVGKSR